ncbi:MAG TPA: hypothetical protein VHR41_18430 [Gemmatimonadales bacterium]|jgi:hypothetical protein|nr:hypothetical protein [Gemmatimonadales bacterium]
MMRISSLSIVTGLALAACGGDSTGPKDVFPEAKGVYEVNGSFDGISTSDAHFSGALTLTQISRETGTLGGSAAYTVIIGTQSYDFTEDSLSAATVSANGVVTYTMGEGGSTWTFTGTLSGPSIVDGHHTLSESSGSVSGAWTATR